MQEVRELIWQRFEALDPVLDEQGRRRLAAAEARALRQHDPQLVAYHGQGPLSERAAPDDHGRRRRLERRAHPVVEDRIAEVCRRDRHPHHRLPPAAWRQQMENAGFSGTVVHAILLGKAG